MRPDFRIDVDTAIGNWLDAREEFLTATGAEALDRFNDTNMELYAAFVQDWHGDLNEQVVNTAFHQFRKFLMQEIDRGDHTRVKYHPCPVTPARA